LVKTSEMAPPETDRKAEPAKPVRNRKMMCTAILLATRPYQRESTHALAKVVSPKATGKLNTNWRQHMGHVAMSGLRHSRKNPAKP
jgi:hypothetical protein